MSLLKDKLCDVVNMRSFHKTNNPLKTDCVFKGFIPKIGKQSTVLIFNFLFDNPIEIEPNHYLLMGVLTIL